jgi:hypothetical protein
MKTAEIRKVVNRLKAKYRAEILFITTNNVLASTIGPAAVLSTTREKLMEVLRMRNISEVNGPLPGQFDDDQTGHERFILVNPAVIARFKVTTAEEIEVIISHEYGHVITFSQLSQDDWAEYLSKVQMCTGLVQIFHGEDHQASAEMQLYYWQLKPEAIANKAVGLKAEDMMKAIFKTVNKGIIKSLNMQKIVDLKFPQLVINTTKASMRGQMPSEKDLLEIISFTKSFYQAMILDKTKLQELVVAIDDSVKSYKEMMANGVFEAAATGSDKPTAGSADDGRPESDNPVRDTMMDVDRALTNTQQQAKKFVQGTAQAGRAAFKPVKRTQQWVSNMVNQWKDYDENTIKEKMADPHERSNLWKGVKAAIIGGSLFKAGLLLNPFFLFLGITRGVTRSRRHERIRNEMIGELKAELEVIDMKIADAGAKGDNKAKYQLVRFKNEINKKLIRVGSGNRQSRKKIAKMI